MFVGFFENIPHRINHIRTVMEAAGMPCDEQNRLACLADKTVQCEFCWGDGYRGDDPTNICHVCKGKCYRKPGLGDDDD